MLNNEIKKILYKKILKKELVLISMSIDSNISFKAYKTQFITIDDHLMWYKFNFNGVIYNTILKTEYSGPALKSTRNDIIEWEITIIISKLRNQKTYKNQKKKKKKNG